MDRPGLHSDRRIIIISIKRSKGERLEHGMPRLKGEGTEDDFPIPWQ